LLQALKRDTIEASRSQHFFDTESFTPVAVEGRKMTKYTLEEANDLMGRLQSSGLVFNLLPKDCTFIVEEPALNCHVLSIWLYILYTKHLNRIFVYEWMDICYCSIREIPVRMIRYKEILYKRKLGKIIMKWRLETGK
jgi:hypothetical protein